MLAQVSLSSQFIFLLQPLIYLLKHANATSCGYYLSKCFPDYLTDETDEAILGAKVSFKMVH